MLLKEISIMIHRPICYFYLKTLFLKNCVSTEASKEQQQQRLGHGTNRHFKKAIRLEIPCQSNHLPFASAAWKSPNAFSNATNLASSPLKG